MTMGARQPVLFVSHGSPMIAIDPGETGRAWAALGPTLPRPRAILAVSALWEARAPIVSAAEAPETIHDFFGFPEALHRVSYPAPGAPWLAERVAALTGARVHPTRGLDHGAWAPALHLFPAADIPITQLSVQPEAFARDHRDLGAALRPLREEGVLILASGSLTHDLRGFRRFAEDAPPTPYAQRFDAWADEVVARGDMAAMDRAEEHPDFAANHPTPEHFLPLPVAMGAAGGPGLAVHARFAYSTLSMRAFLFA